MSVPNKAGAKPAALIVPPKEEPKKEEVKVGGEVKADAKVAAPPPTDGSDSQAPDYWKQWNRWHAAFVVGGGGVNMGNDEGFDHSGLVIGGQLGVNFELGSEGRHVITPYGFVRSQSLGKDLGAGESSNGSILKFGVGGRYIYQLSKPWFGFGPSVEIGGAHYSASDPKLDMNTGLTAGGIEFNRNAMKLPMSSTGAHLGLGVDLCTLGLGLCLNGQIFTNLGMGQTYEFVDASATNPPANFNTTGWEVKVMIDVPRLIGLFTGENSKPATGSVTINPPPKPEDKGPADAGKPGEAGKPLVPGKPEEGKAPAPAKELSITELVQVASGAVDKAKVASETSEKDVKNGELAVKMDPPDLGTARILAKDAMDRSAEATAAAKDARDAVAKLEAKVAKSDGQEKKDAQAALKQAKESSAKVDQYAAKAYTNAQKAHKAYAGKAGASNDLDISKLEVPPGGVAPKKTTTYVPPKGDDKKEPKKEEKKEPKKEEKKEPKKEEKKEEKKDPLQWGAPKK